MATLRVFAPRRPPWSLMTSHMPPLPQVVPTEYHNRLGRVTETHQYSVSEYSAPIPDSGEWVVTLLDAKVASPVPRGGSPRRCFWLISRSCTCLGSESLASLWSLRARPPYARTQARSWPRSTSCMTYRRLSSPSTTALRPSSTSSSASAP